MRKRINQNKYRTDTGVTIRGRDIKPTFRTLFSMFKMLAKRYKEDN